MSYLATMRHGTPGTAHLVQLGERMALKPLRDLVLVDPDDQPAQTDGGILLPSDRHHVPTSGTVVAVGDGPPRDTSVRLRTIQRCSAIVDDLAELVADPAAKRLAQDIVEELGRYSRQVSESASDVAVGDHVVYPAESGLKLTEAGREYVLLREADIIVVETARA